MGKLRPLRSALYFWSLGLELLLSPPTGLPSKSIILGSVLPEGKAGQGWGEGSADLWLPRVEM